MECHICYEQEELLTLGCKHTVCAKCTAKNMYLYKRYKCSICRQDIKIKEIKKEERPFLSMRLFELHREMKNFMLIHHLNIILSKQYWIPEWLDPMLFDITEDEEQFTLKIIQPSIRHLLFRAKLYDAGIGSYGE